jgi:hypothetical protein
VDAAIATGVRRVNAQVVWVAKDDGSDIIRADTIAGVGRDYNGDITARLAGGEGSAVTLVTPGTSDGPHTPEDFHRQLIKIVAELSHAAEATVVRPVCDEAHGWRWVNGPM